MTLMALVATLALPACNKADANKAEQKEEPAIPVEVGSVDRGGIDAAYRGTATIEAEEEATVMSKQEGVIEQVLVEEGDRVRRGQVLARLETDRLKLEVAQAEAEVQRLTEDFNRLKSVYQRNLVSREAYEKTKYELDGQLAAWDLAKLALRESEIRAPFDGVVTARYVKLGNLIQNGAEAFRVTQLDQLRAAIYVPERDIHKLKRNHNVSFSVDAWPDQRGQGHVMLINPVIDPETGTVKVTVAVAGGQSALKPGMFARAEILYDRKTDALLVPRDAVINEDAQQIVYVVADGKSLRRIIRTGYSDSEHFEVLEGLDEGEQVVTTGQANLRDDAKVIAVNTGDETSHAEPELAASADQASSS